jgi:hypothetical protein
MATELTQKFKKIFEGSEEGFYLSDPNKVTVKPNGGERWETARGDGYQELNEAIQGHLEGSQRKGVVLPPINKDNKCKWGAVDIDGNIYKDDKEKINIIKKINQLDLPIMPCFSKSKGLHLYVFFTDWVDASLTRKILKTLLHKLNLPQDTEIFPKQDKINGKGIGNGIMLPFMSGVGNDYIYAVDNGKFKTGSLEAFIELQQDMTLDAESFKIDIPEPETNNKIDFEKDKQDHGYTKWEILKKIKDGTIEQHKPIGGHYYAWIQVIICKCIKQGFGDNEILKLIKEVHKDSEDSPYVFPESYKNQINYTRGQRQLNKPNPGDTKFLEKTNIDTALKLDQVKKNYCYVMANDMFNKLGSPEFYQKQQINNFHKHEIKMRGALTDHLLGRADFAKAETFMTNAKYPPGLVHINKPGMIPLMDQGVVLNIYIPNYLEPKEGDVKFIIDFFIWLLGEKKWRIIEQWLAYMLQYPGEKMKWAVVIVSAVEGVGKGLLARIGSRILGYHNVNENANYKHLTNTHNTLLIGTQLLVLNEVSLGDFKSKNEGTNTLKNFVADDFYSCNFKNKPMVKLPNLTNIMLFSNDERVLGVSDGGRRYHFSNIKKTEEEILEKQDFFDKAWNFVDSDEGASALIHYFKNVKIDDPSIFKKRAPQTDDLKELIEQSKHPVIKKLEYDLNKYALGEYALIFDGKFSGLATFDWLNEQLSTPSDIHKFDWGSYGDDALYKFLASNCTKWNNGENTRQIEIKGHRLRFYLLDDTRCPIPGKSYKDLTPKDIQIIYENFTNIREEIRDEPGNYEEAKNNLEKQIKDLKKEIKNALAQVDRLPQTYKDFKGKTVEQIYEGLRNGTIKLNKDKFKDAIKELKDIKKNEEIIARGIRSPEEIFETYKDENKEKYRRKTSY